MMGLAWRNVRTPSSRARWSGSAQSPYPARQLVWGCANRQSDVAVSKAVHAAASGLPQGSQTSRLPWDDRYHTNTGTGASVPRTALYKMGVRTISG